jgi:hypothetical protein
VTAPTPAAGAPAATPSAPAGTAPAEQGQVPAGQPTPAGPAPVSAPAPVQQQPGNAGQVDLSTLPEPVQKMIADLRTEAAGHRTKATAAEQAQQATLDKIAVALGLKPDEKADPAKLAEQLTASQAAARQSAVQLAVYQAASKAGANAAALLDSVGFANATKDLDPTAADFAAQVEKAIAEAVTANPLLKATPAGPARSGGQFTGAPGAPDQITEDQLKTMTPEQIVEAQAKGQLRNLLGG